jgi:hypothetical protein
MFAFTLESLVLRGSVLRDVLAVGLRLGTGLGANPTLPADRNSMRHPSASWPTPDGQGVVKPDVGYPTKGIMPGAGRSRRRQPGSCAPTGAARTTCRASHALTWRPASGGAFQAVAAIRRAITARVAAPASEAALLLAVGPVGAGEG